ncbi:ComEC/Rec2 family competence protein [Candidatus Shapirobacteria bacterium]|nr:ComEC/Rec2 family competence protein [Candidatus Shapirobacteria bacterium]
MKINSWLVLVLAVFLIYKFVDKNSLMVVIQRNLPFEEAGLLGGMILGDLGKAGAGLKTELQNSGLIHLVVVSGANVMLLATMTIEWWAKYLGRRRAIILGLILLVEYTSLVGWQIPVLRAGLLVLIKYGAQLVGRKFNKSRAIILLVFIMFLADVRVLTQVSFWLTMLAFGGVLLAEKSNKKGVVIETVTSSLWVTILITPVLALVFGKISLVGVATNLLVVPLVEFLTVIGGIGMVTGLKIFFWLALPGLKYLRWVIEVGGSGVGVIDIKFNWMMLVGWYIIIIYFLLKNRAHL